MRKILLALAVMLAPLDAYGQAVQQSGTITPNHVPAWVTNGVVQDGGTASDSPISSLGVTNNGGNGICVSTGRSTAAGRQQLCLSASLGGAGTISLQNYGTAVAQNLRFLINGTEIIIPTGGGSAVPTITLPLVNNDAICASGTTGILKDCGVAIAAGTQFGIPYYSTTAIISSTAAGTNGQVFLGQTGAAPAMMTLGGDVSSISAAGLLTLQKVNGIPFASTYGVHGVLIGQGTAQFNSVTTSNVGQCLLSQGASTDPIWSSCASGSGSAGGSNTQVQFNNSTSLGGSPNLTWVTPTLTIGVAGTTTGQLALAPAGSGSGTVTIQNPSTTVAYNFNLPTTGGSSGQALLSGGGGSTAMSFGTLGVAAGGTNCSTATGTCLDNITGFSSTGYINRTGGGTYAFSTVIPVSGGGTNLANGTSGGILGFTGTSTIASSALLTQFGVMVGGGAGATPTAITPGSSGQILIQQTGANPSWNSMSGDATLSNAGALTVANSAITNAKLANATAGYSFKGNVAGSPGVVTDFTPASLSNKASPAAGDYIVIADNAASGQLKYSTVASIAVAGSVSSVNTATGAVTLLMSPQGRLTLISGVPVMTSDQTAKNTVYYDCYNGNQVPYYTGSADVLDTIASCEVSTSMAGTSTGALTSANVFDVWWEGNTNHNICVATNGSGGGWASDTAGSNTARGTGYSQLDHTTRAYVTNKNALTHCYNGTSDYGSIPANRATYIGTIYTTANGQTGMAYKPSAGSGGTNNVLGVYNGYNRLPVTALNRDSTSTWPTSTVGSSAFETLNHGTSSGTLNRITYVDGLQQSTITGRVGVALKTNANGVEAQVGVNLDSTTAVPTGVWGTNASTNSITNYGNDNFLPQIGLHYVQAMQNLGSSGTATFFGDAAGAAYQGLWLEVSGM